MHWRKVQQGDKGIAIGFLIGDQVDDKLRAALPGWSIVCTVEGPTSVTATDLELARALVALPADAPCGLFGWSAGCQGVRSALIGNGVQSLAFVACFDGTAANFPTPAPWQISVWSGVMARARADEIVGIFTASSMTYTERLASPFMATSHVLEKAGGFTLAPGKPVVEGSLYVERFASADIDKEAHIRQVNEVMPRLLGELIGQRTDLGAMLRDAVLRPVVDVFRGALSGGPVDGVGATALGRAMAEIGVKETPGIGTTGRVAEYLAGCERNGKKLGLTQDETAWCAAFASWCAQGLADVPHGYRASVAELYADAKKAGAWRDVNDVPKPGDLAIWGRNGEDPRKGGHGHVARVVTASPLVTVGGNEGVYGEVKETTHAATDRPLGWISYP